ncbi:TetR/AcrR family transcriptional regulator [Jiangella asiatica]|uniref:TetR/AcrR family transcriptional regulator n=1 Tax=Jiangella asiatica TaxID=2530372 RepID=A0A4R5DLN8_9ACTN|nr:TetR/AcrR family transcriptional regulator [Jiangella asiatica]TDE11785.1 TetR/AcrR family transcriptional regulator [Jiangella asiatica]
MSATPTVRRRGEALEAAIYDAVWAELAEVGYAGLTIGAVADRARTSKAVLYRRWPGRAELVFAALVQHVPKAADVPDTGDLRSDLVTFLRSIAANWATRSIDALWGLLAETARDPALAALVRSELADQVREGPMTVMVERAVRRGEVDPAVVSPRMLRVPLDLVRSELLLNGAITGTAVEEIVDDVFLPLVRPRTV